MEMKLSSIIIFFLIQFFLGHCVYFNHFEWRDLLGSDVTIPNEMKYWVISSAPGISQNYTICNGGVYLGGYGVLNGNGNYSERIYTLLPNHSMIYYNFRVLLLDSWTGQDYFSFMFDTTEIKFQNFVNDFNDFSTHICGNTNKRGVLLTIVGKVPHSGSKLVFRVYSYLDGSPTVKSFGFRNTNFLFSDNNRLESQEICAFSAISLLNGHSCPCTTKKYRASNGTCANCYVGCANCFGPSSSECYQCATDYYFNGTHCITCHPSCNICSNEDANSCVSCSSPRFLLDSMCVDSCDPPLVAMTSPYRICTYKCASHQFLYTDKSCNNSCPLPLRSYINYTKQFCEYPCSNTTLLYYNGSCLSSLSCPHPLIIRTYGPFQVCDLPCKSSEMLFSNGSCLSSSSCVSPWIKQANNGVDICEMICLNSSYFIYWNKTCHSSCPSPLHQNMLNNLKICELTNCGNEPCKFCQDNNNCSKGYYCNKTFQEGPCMKYISNITYILRPELMKNLQNECLIRVEVTPILYIPNTDDDLLANIASLENISEYTTETKKLSKGVYEVKLIILQPLKRDVTSININFTYTSLYFDLQANLDIPRIIYVSTYLQNAAFIAQMGSYISFAIMNINIIGFAMTGGLSALWSFLPENQYAYYLLYLNVPYPHHTKVYLRSLANYDLLFESSGDNDIFVDREIKRSLPARFVDEEYSKSFLENAGQVIKMALIIFSVILVLTLLVKILASTSRLYLAVKLLKIMKRILKWNGIVRQFLAYSLPLAFASFIQFHVAIFGKESLFLISVLAEALLFILLLGFVRTYQIMKNIPLGSYERIVYSEWYGTLWEGLELDNSSRYYYWFLTMRGIILAYLSVFFEIWPYAQISSLIICQFIIVSLFFNKFRVRKVFCNKILNMVALIEEILLLIMKLAIFTFLVLTDIGFDDQIMIIMGWIMIGPKIITQVMQSIFGFAMQIIERKKIINILKETAKRICQRKLKKVKIKRFKLRK